MSKYLPFFLLVLLACSLNAPAQPVVLDRVVAVVGKEPILLSDLTDKVAFYIFNNKIDPETPGLQKDVLDLMINEKLIITSALEDTNISVTEDEITNELDAVVAQRIQQLGSERKVEEVYGMPISRMKREYRDDMRKQLLATKHQQLKFSKITVSKREVEEFYNQFRDSLPRVPEEYELYHIVRSPGVGASVRERKMKQAEALADSVRAGADFADIARRYSQDLGTAKSGGDLPFVRRGEFVREFEEAAFALKDSQISPAVETSFGIHIIQMLERRGESIHVRHILLRMDRDSASINEAKALLASYKDSIAGGQTFFELAKKYSGDARTSSVGGYLGRVTAEQLDAPTVEKLKTLGEGDISDPIEVGTGGEGGYQILYVKRRIPEHAMSLTDDWARLEQMATSYKSNREFRTWIDELRKNVYWETRL